MKSAAAKPFGTKWFVIYKTDDDETKGVIRLLRGCGRAFCGAASMQNYIMFSLAPARTFGTLLAPHELATSELNGLRHRSGKSSHASTDLSSGGHIFAHKSPEAERPRATRKSSAVGSLRVAATTSGGGGRTQRFISSLARASICAAASGKRRGSHTHTKNARCLLASVTRLQNGVRVSLRSSQ